MDEVLRRYDETIEALVAHDEKHDPARAALLRSLFVAQKLFFHLLAEAIQENSTGVTNLADRVQGHISRQLMDITLAEERTGTELSEHRKILLSMQDVLKVILERSVQNGAETAAQ